MVRKPNYNILSLLLKLNFRIVVIHDENQKSIYNKKPHGIWLSYYENGNMRTNSYYDNGKPDKEWKSFYENGKVKSIMIYKDKKYISYTKYDENGAILN